MIMTDPKAQKQIRIIRGIILIMVGILIIFLLLRFQFDDCANRWLNNLDGFGKKYSSVWDCFWTRSKAAIVISLILGAFPIGFGLRICTHRQQNN